MTPLEKFCAGDAILLEKSKEICSWFPSTKTLVQHTLQLSIDARMDEIEWIIPDRFKGVTCFGVFVWAMREAMESSDPRQPARWYSYGSRRGPPNRKIKRELTAIPGVRYVQHPHVMSLHRIMPDNV